MPTVEIFAGVGTGTTGSSFSAGLKEKNYLGKGITLDTNFALSENEVRGKFSVLNPNFSNSDRSLNTTIESTVSDLCHLVVIKQLEQAWFWYGF